MYLENMTHILEKIHFHYDLMSLLYLHTYRKKYFYSYDYLIIIGN